MAVAKNKTLRCSISYSEFLLFKFKGGSLAPPPSSYHYSKIKERPPCLVSAKPVACGSTTCSSASSTCVAAITKTNNPSFLSVVGAKVAFVLNGGLLRWIRGGLSTMLSNVYRFYTTKSEQQLWVEKQEMSQAWLGVGTLVGFITERLGAIIHSGDNASIGGVHRLTAAMGGGASFVGHHLSQVYHGVGHAVAHVTGKIPEPVWTALTILWMVSTILTIIAPGKFPDPDNLFRAPSVPPVTLLTLQQALVQTMQANAIPLLILISVVLLGYCLILKLELNAIKVALAKVQVPPSSSTNV